MDIEYRDTGVLIRRPAPDTLDRSAELARKVSRAAREKSPVRKQTDGYDYDPCPLATASTHSPPRGILKSRKHINKTEFGESGKSGNSSRQEQGRNSGDILRQKIAWQTRLTESIKPRCWAEHCDERTRFEKPLSSNEGSLHEFPASLTQRQSKDGSPFLHRGTDSARGSVSSIERALQDEARVEELKKQKSCSEDSRCWEPKKGSGGTLVGLEDGRHRQEVKRGCVENIGLEESEIPEGVDAAPGEKRLVARNSKSNELHTRAEHPNGAGVSDAVHRRRVARGTRAALTHTDKHLTEERKAMWGQ